MPWQLIAKLGHFMPPPSLFLSCLFSNRKILDSRLLKYCYSFSIYAGTKSFFPYNFFEIYSWCNGGNCNFHLTRLIMDHCLIILFKICTKCVIQ